MGSKRAALALIAFASCGGEAAPVAGSAATVAPSSVAPAPQVRLERCGEVELLPPRAVEYPNVDGSFGGAHDGFGPGGGTIGIGRYGTASWDSGTGSGYGVGGHRSGRDYPEAVPGPITATGPLDPATIRRYLRRNGPRLTYCYEKQLLAVPGLRGTVQVEWTIGANGKVTTARARGVHPDIAACIGRDVLGIEFPAPHDGGTVDAKVAFTLTPHDRSPPASAPGADDWVVATPPPPPPPPAPTPWTSFARPREIPSLPASDGAAGASQAAVAARMPAISACFPGDGPTGSLRAVLRADNRGTIVAVATGGLGDAAIEACVSKALVGITAIPIACDFTRGSPAPWRVSRAGYAVLEIGDGPLRLDGTEVHPSENVPRAIALDATVLVIARPTAPAAEVERAIAWAGPGHDVVLAIAQTWGPEFASAFAMAPRGAGNPLGVHPRPVLAFRGPDVQACVNGKWLDARAPIADGAALDALLAAVTAACDGGACDRVIEVVPADTTAIVTVQQATEHLRRASRVPVVVARASDARCW